MSERTDQERWEWCRSAKVLINFSRDGFIDVSSNEPITIGFVTYTGRVTSNSLPPYKTVEFSWREAVDELMDKETT